METARFVTEDAMEKFTALKLYPIGSIVIAMYGATIGRLGVLGIPATTNQACCVMEPNDIVVPRYLYLWLLANRNEIVALGAGGGQPNISQEIIRSLRVPVPPRAEQVAIVAYIDRSAGPLDDLIQKVNRAIGFVKERRSALITAAVTGQIDVRTYGAQNTKGVA